MWTKCHSGDGSRPQSGSQVESFDGRTIGQPRTASEGDAAVARQHPTPGIAGEVRDDDDADRPDVLSPATSDGAVRGANPMRYIGVDPDAPKDRSWWVVLWEQAESLLRMDERISLPPTVYVPYMLHEDRAAGILAHTFPYRRGLRELSLGLMVVHVPPEEQTGYRITDHDRRNLLEYCASELGFPSLDHSAADGAIALSVWYGDAHIYQVSRCLADLGLDLPLLRGETAVQLWYDIARDDYRNPAPFHGFDPWLRSIPMHVLATYFGAPAIVGCSLVAARVTGGVRELERRTELHAATLAKQPALQQLRDHLRNTWKAGDRIPWPLDGRHGFDTEPILQNPPGMNRGARS
jgi:hypothetical protein